MKYEVIATYPESPYKVGDIEDGLTWSENDSLDNYPAIFRKIERSEPEPPQGKKWETHYANTANPDLRTLKLIRDMFNLHSDGSAVCNGYRSLCSLIEEMDKVTSPQGKTMEELMCKIWDCDSIDLQLSITLSPEKENIVKAMFEWASIQTADLAESLVKVTGEKNKLKKQLEEKEEAIRELVEFIDGVDKSLYIGEDLKDGKIMDWYIQVCSTIKEDANLLIQKHKQ
jgi:hypothetical protein